ncbi:MAG: hypothetical protein OEO18_16985 [Gammaproteobacteria bacterium]|nr:hypothetical protein [Gammaproteobacteria bacterium]
MFLMQGEIKVPADGGDDGQNDAGNQGDSDVFFTLGGGIVIVHWALPDSGLSITIRSNNHHITKKIPREITPPLP